MRLIDADALENRMYHESFEKDSDLQKWDSGCWIRYKLFEQVLRATPTIDLTPPTSSNTNVPDTNVGELINRRDAIETLKDEWVGVPVYYLCGEDIFEYSKFRIESLPSLQPRKGKWTRREDGMLPIICECSVCGFDTTDFELFSFCPICGSRMGEGDSDNNH